MLSALLLVLSTAAAAATEEQHARMRRAIDDASLVAVKALLQEGVDPLTAPQGRFEGSFLMQAARQGDEAVFNQLFSLSENRLTKARLGSLLRHNATEAHTTNRQILETLAAKGADTRYEIGGLTAVAYAARMGNLVALRFFMDKGHDVSARAFPGGPEALSSSVGCRNDAEVCAEVFALLLARGARPTLWAFEQARRTLNDARGFDASVRQKWIDATTAMIDAMTKASRAEEARCRADAGLTDLAWEFLRLRKEEPSSTPRQYEVRGRVEDAGCVILLPAGSY